MIYEGVEFGKMNLEQTLWKVNGKKVTLFLRSGHNLSGVLSMDEQQAEVGLPKQIHIKELMGEEMFDAVVQPEEIAGIKFRAKSI